MGADERDYGKLRDKFPFADEVSFLKSKGYVSLLLKM